MRRKPNNKYKKEVNSLSPLHHSFRRKKPPPVLPNNPPITPRKNHGPIDPDGIQTEKRYNEESSPDRTKPPEIFSLSHTAAIIIGAERRKGGGGTRKVENRRDVSIPKTAPKSLPSFRPRATRIAPSSQLLPLNTEQSDLSFFPKLLF